MTKEKWYFRCFEKLDGKRVGYYAHPDHPATKVNLSDSPPFLQVGEPEQIIIQAKQGIEHNAIFSRK